MNLRAESGQALPESSLQEAPPGRIPGRRKSSPLVPLGLHSLFACLRAINPAVVFFCHTFCNPRFFGTLLFIVPQKNQ